MQDFEVAKKRLIEENLTLSIVKDSEVIFESISHGISGFLEAIERFEEKLEGASVADRIAGKAVAMLCVHTKIRAVYAVILSKKARALLEMYRVYHEWANLVETILDLDKAETCPFEKLAAQISDPSEAYERLSKLQRSFSRRKGQT